MSGSGGFYKYRCKYFLTHDCPNWVYVNNAPCADCCAAGRDMDDDDLADAGQRGRFAMPEFEIGVPVFQDGVLRYSYMDVLARAEPGADFVTWTLPPQRYNPQQPVQPGPAPPHPQHLPPQHLAPQQPPRQMFQQQQQHSPHPQLQQQLPPHVLQQQQQQQQAAKMQLPPHAASKAFPPAGGVGVLPGGGNVPLPQSSPVFVNYPGGNY